MLLHGGASYSGPFKVSFQNGGASYTSPTWKGAWNDGLAVARPSRMRHGM
jgi:hypothetical protein